MRTGQEGFLLRFYRRLLRLYPAAFREEYQAEMEALVADTHERRSRFTDTLRLCASLAADVIATAPRHHLELLSEDLRHASRAYRKSPAVTACLLLVFAIGVGATTAVFTLTNAVLLRPLPFAQPDRLVFLDESAPARNIDSMGTNFPNLLEFQRENRSFSGIGAYFEGEFSLTGEREPERLGGASVSWNLFDVLGVQPFLGRTFRPEEDQPHAETSVILGHGLWQRRYGADPGILGRTILVGGKPRTVVGVMPRGFRFPENGELWVPMGLDTARHTRTDYFITALGRLAPGNSLERAAADMDAVMAGIARRHPEEAGDVKLTLVPARESLTGEYAPVLIRLLAAALFVFAIACTNVTSLLLARASGRQREIAVRTTLGANRRRVVRQLVTESLLVGVTGGALGVLLGVLIIPAVLRSAPIELPYWIRFEPDWRVLLFSVATMVVAGIGSGLGPALHTTRLDLTRVLNDGGKAASAGRHSGRLREGLVALQLALSVVLLVGAGLMVRSFVNLAHVDLGFRTGDALTFQLSLSEVGYDKTAIAPFYQRAAAALAAIPGVERVSGASMSPFGGQWWRTFLPEGESKTRLAELPAALNVVVTPGYFAAMGIPLDRGRDFSDADGTAAPVVIVNRTLANRFWPGQNPVGRRVKIDSFLPDSPWRTVVGIAGDVRWTNPRDPAPLTVYVPHAFEPIRSMTMVVRSTAPAPMLVRDVRSVVRRLDPELPLAAVRPMSAIVSRAVWNFRLYTQMFALFAGIAILLAAVGLGGIMSQMVIERTHEIGIRVAVGATPGDIVTMVLRRVSLLVLLGIGAGLAAALALARTLSTLLFGVTPEDAPTLALVLVLLGLVAFAAGLIPARQASRVSPLLALRTE